MDELPPLPEGFTDTPPKLPPLPLGFSDTPPTAKPKTGAQLNTASALKQFYGGGAKADEAAKPSPAAVTKFQKDVQFAQQQGFTSFNERLKRYGQSPSAAPETMQVGPVKHVLSETGTKTSIPGKKVKGTSLETDVESMPASPKGVLARSALGLLKTVGFGEQPTPIGVAAKLIPGGLAAMPAKAALATGTGLSTGAMLPEMKRAIEENNLGGFLTALGIGLSPLAGHAVASKVSKISKVANGPKTGEINVPSKEQVKTVGQPEAVTEAAPAPVAEIATPAGKASTGKPKGGSGKPAPSLSGQEVAPEVPAQYPVVKSDKGIDFEVVKRNNKGATVRIKDGNGATYELTHEEFQAKFGQKAPRIISIKPKPTEQVEPASPTSRRVTGISERVRTGMAQEGRAAPYEAGQGSGPAQMKALGRTEIASGIKPEEHIAMMEKRGKAVEGRDMAILAAHDDALVRAADKAHDALRADPSSPALQDAYKKARDTQDAWYKRISPYRTEFNPLGSAMQGETDVDTGSFTSMARHFQEVNKRPLDEGTREAAAIQKHVQRISQLEKDLAAKDEQIAASSKAASASTVKTVGKSKVPTSQAELAAHFAKRKQSGSLYAEKSLTKEAGAIRLNKGDPQFTLDELKAIGDYSNTYFGKTNPATGRGYETADVVARVANELGLTSDEVLHAYSRNKTAPRTVTDEMYAARAARRQAKKDALDYVENANRQPIAKAISAIPSVYRSTKVFGHGTVGMTTHGGPNLLMPLSERAVYWPGQAKQLAMALSPSLTKSEILHEKMLTDIENNPLYNTARQGGLKVDPYRVQDDVQKYARFLGGTGNTISRLAKRGDMGMDVLKWARMQDFTKKWGQLDPDLKTPDMAKELSNMVNHAWGSSDSRLGKAGNLLFSPSLQGAHWARVIGDPAKTIGTYADVAFNKGRNTSPEKIAIAKMRLKRAAEFAGMYGGALVVNNAMLSANGQKDRVNFTDPTKSDWMQPKWDGKTLAMGLSQGPLHVLSQVARDVAESDVSRLAKDVFQYGRGKLHPAIETGIETATRKDYFGRPLPFADAKMKAKSAKTGKPALTPAEYAWTFSPIPAEGIAKAYFESMRENGATQDQSLRMWKSIKRSAGEAPFDLLGFHVGKASEEYPVKQKHARKVKF